MFRSIVVGTDGSATATAAVHRARTLAGAFGADLHVVSAYQCPAAVLSASADPGFGPNAVVEWNTAARDQVRRVLDGVADNLGGTGSAVPTQAITTEAVTTHAVAGHAATAILSVAEQVNADLIVVGNRGMRGVGRMLGSVPNHISHHARCDVLIVDTVDAADLPG